MSRTLWTRERRESALAPARSARDRIDGLIRAIPGPAGARTRAIDSLISAHSGLADAMTRPEGVVENHQLGVADPIRFIHGGPARSWGPCRGRGVPGSRIPIIEEWPAPVEAVRPPAETCGGSSPRSGWPGMWPAASPSGPTGPTSSSARPRPRNPDPSHRFPAVSAEEFPVSICDGDDEEPEAAACPDLRCLWCKATIGEGTPYVELTTRLKLDAALWAAAREGDTGRYGAVTRAMEPATMALCGGCHRKFVDLFGRHVHVTHDAGSPRG